jgi:hypothetical protein
MEWNDEFARYERLRLRVPQRHGAFVGPAVAGTLCGLMLYAMGISYGNATCRAAFGVLIAGAIVSVAAHQARQRIRLKHRCQDTQGEVIGKWIDKRWYGLRAYCIAFKYAGHYTGYQVVSRADYQVLQTGQRVPVHYLPQAPRIACIDVA